MLTKEMLTAHHAEEIAGAEEYEHWAEECPEWAHVLRDMASDERAHAAMVSHIADHLKTDSSRDSNRTE